MKAIHEAIKVTQPFPPASRNTANTLYNNAAIGSAAGIDTKDFDEALVILNLGTLGDTTLDVSVGFADVDDAEDASFALLTDAEFPSMVDANDDEIHTIRIRVKEQKRYMFVKAILADAVAVNYAVTVALGKADVEPVTQEETVNFTDESAA